MAGGVADNRYVNDRDIFRARNSEIDRGAG
jgi:hypothetical protein